MEDVLAADDRRNDYSPHIEQFKGFLRENFESVESSTRAEWHRKTLEKTDYRMHDALIDTISSLEEQQSDQHSERADDSTEEELDEGNSSQPEMHEERASGGDTDERSRPSKKRSRPRKQSVYSKTCHQYFSRVKRGLVDAWIDINQNHWQMVPAEQELEREDAAEMTAQHQGIASIHASQEASEDSRVAPAYHMPVLSSELFALDSFLIDNLQEEGFSAFADAIGARPYEIGVEVHLTEDIKKEIDGLRERLFEDDNNDGDAALWCIARFTFPHDDKALQMEHHMPAKLLYTASPTKASERALVFFEEALDGNLRNKIESEYDLWPLGLPSTSFIKLSTMLDEALPHNGGSWELHALNLGHANCIYLKQKSGKGRILHDIGLRRRSVSTRSLYKGLSDHEKKATKVIAAIKPSIVVLSHWDQDHINGTLYANRNVFDAQWIAPSFKYYEKDNEKPSVYARRLATYLILRGKLAVVEAQGDKKQHCKIAELDNNGYKLQLFLGGQGHKDGHLTMHNRRGIVLRCKTKVQYNNGGGGTVTLSMGDVPYSSLEGIDGPNKSILEDCDYLIVPHHCSKMNCEELKRLTKSQSGSSPAVIKHAFVSEVSNKCDISHMSELVKVFNVQCSCPASSNTQYLYDLSSRKAPTEMP